MATDAFRTLARPFARGLLDKAEALRDTSFTQYQRARLVESMAVDVRKACDVIVPAERFPEVSAAALEVAEPLGLDLYEQTWHAQPKVDKGRMVFHYEHKTPVSHLVAGVRRCGSADQVIQVLDQDLHVAWILKDENRELGRLGFTHRRPDPDAAYAAAGIALMPSRPDRTSPDDQTRSTKMDRLTWQPGDIKVYPPKTATARPDPVAKVSVPLCSRCGSTRATWLVTGGAGSQAPGRIFAYCDTCRAAGENNLAVSLPLQTFGQNPELFLEAIYGSRASGTDPSYVAELFGIPMGRWASRNR